MRRRHRRRKANPKVEENFFPIPSSHSPFRIPILVGDLEEHKSFFLLPFPQAALPIPIRIFGMRMLRGKILQTIGQWFANSFPSPISGDSTYVVILCTSGIVPVTSAILFLKKKNLVCVTLRFPKVKQKNDPFPSEGEKNFEGAIRKPQAVTKSGQIHKKYRQDCFCPSCNRSARSDSIKENGDIPPLSGN